MSRTSAPVEGLEACVDPNRSIVPHRGSEVGVIAPHRGSEVGVIDYSHQHPAWCHVCRRQVAIYCNEACCPLCMGGAIEITASVRIPPVQQSPHYYTTRSRRPVHPCAPMERDGNSGGTPFLDEFIRNVAIEAHRSGAPGGMLNTIAGSVYAGMYQPTPADH